LEAAGYHVCEVDDVDSALDFTRERPVDLVLLDSLAEAESGGRFCRELRQIPSAEFTPVLILIEAEESESVQQVLECGASDFAIKPLQGNLLRYRIESMLRTARMAEELRVSEKRLATAQRIAKLGHWEWTFGEEEFWCSTELKRLMGGAPKQAFQALEMFLAMVHVEDRERVRKTIHEALSKRQGYQLDHRIVLPDGTVRAIEQDVQVVREDPKEPERLLGIIHDVTDRWQVQHQVQKLSFYDQVTGLPNRAQLLEEVTVWVDEAAQREERMALIWLDLDHFERINDTLGHASGDHLLRCVADRLKLSLLEAESKPLWQPPYQAHHQPFLCRLGGDEFVIALPHLPSLDNIALVLESLQENISLAAIIDGTEITVTSSLGVSVFPEDGPDLETLMRNAGTAMHSAKRAGRNRSQYFKHEFSERARQYLVIESELRKAMEDEQFVLFYQPKVNLREQKVEGMEALVRWNHPEMGLVSPADFIPVAEQCGMILPLGKWVLEQALRDVAQWNQAGLPAWKVSVNVSGMQLQQTGFLEMVQDSLATSGVPGNQLELELTEGLLMNDTDSSIRILSELSRRGITVSIDDFGTGYSSLSYLTRFPISALKIDRSFVHQVTQHQGNQAIVGATIALAHSLHMHVVAEGVEERPELEFLEGLGCDAIQVYYFSSPLPAEDFVEWAMAYDAENEAQGQAA